jgi:hypothetical protein
LTVRSTGLTVLADTGLLIAAVNRGDLHSAMRWRLSYRSTRFPKETRLSNEAARSQMRIQCLHLQQVKVCD